METTINTILKHNALPAAALSVLIYLQVGMGGDIQDVRDDIQALHTEMVAGYMARARVWGLSIFEYNRPLDTSCVYHVRG